MASTTLTHYITVIGADIEAKRARKIKKGDSLSATRIHDDIDTYEILISTNDAEPIEMIGYLESLGVSPFLDNGQAKISSITVTDVTLRSGAKRSEDETTIAFEMVLEYDDTVLTPFNAYSFIPMDNQFYAVFLHCVFTSSQLSLITKTHLNRYEFTVALSDDMLQLCQIEGNGGEYRYCVEALFNEDFSKVKITATILNGDTIFNVELHANECESFLDLINHHRTFAEEEQLHDIEVEVAS